ncbi:MAG: NTP transferase domain-containing protein [Ardenticatenales bacterium]|nr:NTP transferase domain-containing protein [Ardenticatenales bacterium]
MNRGAPDDIAAVVLAAGAGTRMGRAKLHLPWGETTILGQVLAILRDAGVDRIVVAARTGDEAAARTAGAAGAGVAWAERVDAGEAGDCPTPSLQAALAHLADAATASPPLVPPGAVLVMPGDLPLVRPDTVARIIAAFRLAPEGPQAIIAPAFEGRRGHPVLFGAAHLAALAALPSGRWPRDVVRRAGGAVREVAVDDAGVATDIDDASTYARLRPRPP